MADGDVAATRPEGAWRRRSYVKFSAKVAREILRRVSAGEALAAVCRDPGMPHRVTVGRWAKAAAPFARGMAQARQAAGWRHANSPGVAYCEDAAAEIFARLCEGEALNRICEAPHLPATSTVDRWRDQVPDFDRAMRLAREIQGERLCERSLEIADAVTTATAYAAKVRLEHYRWLVRAMAPRRFAPVKAMEAEELDGGADGGGRGMTVIVRKFTDPPGVVEASPEERRMVGRD